MKATAPQWSTTMCGSPSGTHSFWNQRTRLISTQSLFCLVIPVSGNHKTADLSSVNEGSQPEHIYSVTASIIHSR